MQAVNLGSYQRLQDCHHSEYYNTYAFQRGRQEYCNFDPTFSEYLKRTYYICI